MTDGKLVAAIIGGCAIVGSGIVGAAYIESERAPRYAMLKSGFNNTIWVLDQRTGVVTYCGSYKGSGQRCRDVIYVDAVAKPSAEEFLQDESKTP